MTGRTVRYLIAAESAEEAIRTAWESEARGLAMLGADPDDTGDDRRKRGHVYRVRVPARRPDGRITPLGTAEEVAECE